MKKYKYFLDYEKEEKWLNNMAKKGCFLTNKNSFCYEFIQGKPMNLNYRIDYRIFKNKKDLNDYVSLFQDSGWKHISGTTSSGTQYFLSLNSNSLNDIFSDSSSKSKRYIRSLEIWVTFFCSYITLFISFICNGTFNIRTISNYRDLYYTQGLWEMHGVDFWRAFLFETPFVIGREFMWVIYLLLIIVFAFFIIKISLAIRKTKKG